MLLQNSMDICTMPLSSVILQSLQSFPNETDDTFQTGFDEYNYITQLWTREETNSLENSDNSEYFVNSTTAANKQLDFSFTPGNSVSTEWKTKPVKQWGSDDIICWIISVATEKDLKTEDIGVSRFNDIDGTTLYKMSETDFASRESQYGKLLYCILQQLKEEQDQQMGYSRYESEGRVPPVLAASLSGKRRPGRPRLPGRKGKKTEKKTGRLWEFIRDLLLNRDYCPSLICWENHDEGVFRFVRSEKVAKLWGTRKENPKMTYEKLSRAMRYYYRSKVLQPVLGRRLVYKFGPSATGWRTPNPNFRA